MKYADNISVVAKLPIDMLGMIFYKKSPRYIESSPSDTQELINALISNPEINRVGVFVNENIKTIEEKIKQYRLSFVQLHGNETPIFCSQLSKPTSVIKAFSISSIADLENVAEYEGVCSYFLFDTKTSNYGGSGQKFDWSVLDMYKGKTPFMLSGGISIEDVDSIKNINHPLFYGIDINSRFEIEPGLKNVELLTCFIKTLRQ